MATTQIVYHCWDDFPIEMGTCSTQHDTRNEGKC